MTAQEQAFFTQRRREEEAHERLNARATVSVLFPGGSVKTSEAMPQERVRALAATVLHPLVSDAHRLECAGELIRHLTGATESK